MEDQRSNDCDDRAEVDVSKTGVGFKGSTTQLLVVMTSLLPVMALSIVLYFLYQHEENTKERVKDGHAVAKEFVGTLSSMTAAQREMTCMMSLPQEKRERDYNSENSFCKRMARP